MASSLLVYYVWLCANGGFMTDMNYKGLDLTTVEGIEQLNEAIHYAMGWKSIGKMGNGWHLGIPPNNPTELHRITDYATDLNAAMQLQHKGYIRDIIEWRVTDNSRTTNPSIDGEVAWTVKFRSPESYKNETSELHYRRTPNKSLALALCLAWLAVFDAK